MRNLALTVAGCAFLLFVGGGVPALADNGPHMRGAGPFADICADCHRAHTAKASAILVQPQQLVCYACHGASGAGANTDVERGVGYSSRGRTGAVGALRGGGFAFARIDSANPSGQADIGYNPNGHIPVKTSGAAVTSTHSVDFSSQTAWGNGPTSATANYGSSVRLSCGSCHDPHGNGNYRILRKIPIRSGAMPGTTIADAGTKVYTTTDYWRAEDTNAPSFIANIASWCTTCHTRYLAGSGSGSRSSGDAVFTYRHRSNDARQGAPNCIQCHVAHGSNASMGSQSGAVTNPDGTAAVSDSRLLRVDNRGSCQMCHRR